MSLFSAIVGSDEIAAVKPAPDGLERIARQLSVDPRKTAYVGDALYDLRCARAAGAIPVAAGWGHLHEPDVEPHLWARRPAQLVEVLQTKLMPETPNPQERET